MTYDAYHDIHIVTPDELRAQAGELAARATRLFEGGIIDSAQFGQAVDDACYLENRSNEIEALFSDQDDYAASVAVAAEHIRAAAAEGGEL